MTSPMLYGHSLVEWYGRRYVEMNLRATVLGWRMDDPQQLPGDPNTADTEGQIIYNGPARLYQVSGPQVMGGGEDTESVFSSSYITTPLYDESGVPVMTQVNDLFQIIEHQDPLVINLLFRVMDVDAGGQWPVGRRHMVTGAQRSETWDWSPTSPIKTQKPDYSIPKWSDL